MHRAWLVLGAAIFFVPTGGSTVPLPERQYEIQVEGEPGIGEYFQITLTLQSNRKHGPVDHEVRVPDGAEISGSTVWTVAGDEGERQSSTWHVRAVDPMAWIVEVAAKPGSEGSAEANSHTIAEIGFITTRDDSYGPDATSELRVSPRLPDEAVDQSLEAHVQESWTRLIVGSAVLADGLPTGTVQVELTPSADRSATQTATGWPSAQTEYRYDHSHRIGGVQATAYTRVSIPFNLPNGTTTDRTIHWDCVNIGIPTQEGEEIRDGTCVASADSSAIPFPDLLLVLLVATVAVVWRANRRNRAH